ncbi:DnaJ domain-containing protein [Archangium violaceum]|uniref:J domain-containing protein n=1 Tax=Archangium violaceum TaxID=83451 RepID=UPI001950709C|nr:DnaJ domain-containing protein [Archangium violaceum]QRN96787.1 DnaJ domain-containing protein [Archangium violaceum]
MPQDLSPFHDKNPFEVLGLQGTEDLPAIRKAFLTIAAKSHPDRLRTKSEAEKAQALETFLSAKKAFEVLSHPDKRREWSEKLARTRAAPGRPQTPAAPVVPPRETPSAPVPAPVPPRPGPAFTPVHGVPVAPRPGAPVAPPSRGVPAAPPPSRPGPALTPVHGVPTTPPPSRPGPALTPMHGVPVASPPSRAVPTVTPAAPASPEVKTPSLPTPRGGPLPAAMALQLYKLGMLALESADYAKALDLFAKAAKASPTPRNQAMELVSRGHQYLSTRFFDRARESFERALQLLPECREARAGLELIDKQSGRYIKGR